MVTYKLKKGPPTFQNLRNSQKGPPMAFFSYWWFEFLRKTKKGKRRKERKERKGEEKGREEKRGRELWPFYHDI